MTLQTKHWDSNLESGLWRNLWKESKQNNISSVDYTQMQGDEKEKMKNNMVDNLGFVQEQWRNNMYSNPFNTI